MKYSGRFIAGCLCLFVVAQAPQAVAQRWGGEQAALVITQPAGFERTTTRVDVVGYAQALRSVDLYPAVGDEVLAVNFAPGDSVNEGDVLVQLDDRRQQTALQRAKIQLADAERTVERLRTSREQGAIPQSELDNAITNRDLLKVAVREAEVEVEDRKVRAPFDGIVGLTEIEAGDRVTTQTMITSIDQRDQLYVRFDAPEVALGLLQQEPTLTVRPWNDQSAAYQAKLVDVDSRIDTQTRTIGVRAILDNDDDRFRPGMSFRVNLMIEGDSYAVVPEAALMWAAEGAYVWLNRDGRAFRVNVQIKQRLQGRILVAGEIQLGDELVIEGVQQLRQGQNIEVLSAEQTP
ncbi:efflux transporter periplasmic adaptor subunit [Pseudidiomarina aestuarii]|uniref:Efflux transporter periplasmic adaptor subunit n=1 Tax=Pseudidiomarina aestuarii TaxID=624146 RepID=A0A7Z7ETJ7_9GAMM|nr:efflux RND transporter periplasmic adaptor subunit [Pseudidiomarina aestuarii]RUO41095.1 efflux transporter periplasmic adaptor subunit [Pseudidiomarina aestuarii]